MFRSLYPVLVLLVVACGAGKPGPKPNGVYFWRLTASTVDFVQCSDEMGFRDSLKPAAADTNSYFVYRVSADGQHATSQTCTVLDAASCKDAATPLVFDVAATDLLLNKEVTSAISGSTCSLHDSQSWVLSDNATALEMTVSHVLGLTGDDMAACAKLESDAKANSPNGLGIEGCAVTFKLSFSSH